MKKLYVDRFYVQVYADLVSITDDAAFQKIILKQSALKEIYDHVFIPPPASEAEPGGKIPPCTTVMEERIVKQEEP